MTRTHSRSFGATLDDLARDIVDACRRAVRAIAVMPLPAMLACCIALAFVISILPLALFLFVLFMGVKVIIGAFIVDHRRTHREHTSKQ
jgi:fatty acid desaturase